MMARNKPQFEQLFNKNLDICPNSSSCILKHSSDTQDVNLTLDYYNESSSQNWSELIHELDWFTNSLSQWVLLKSHIGASSFLCSSIQVGHLEWHVALRVGKDQGVRNLPVEREYTVCLDENLDTRINSSTLHISPNFDLRFTFPVHFTYTQIICKLKYIPLNCTLNFHSFESHGFFKTFGIVLIN